MADCITDGNVCQSTNHCEKKVPADENRARIITYETYPTIDYGNAQKVPRNHVLYGGLLQQSISNAPSYTSPTSSDNAAASCGKETKAIGCSLFGGDLVVFDNKPESLSFRWLDSDTFFVYVYDTGTNGGIINTPCYYLIEERQSTSSTSTGGTNPPGGTTTGGEAGGTQCVPCTAFSCTPAKTTIKYETDSGDETGDPDAPYPTVFAIGTESKKIVFKYNQLSDQLPDGVTDFSFVYSPDGIDADVWDNDLGSGDPIELSFNPWKSGEEFVTEYVIFEGNQVENGAKQGLSIKVKIQPTLDTTVEPVVITGTTIEALEVINPGQNYEIGDVYTLSYTFIHNDNTTSVFSWDLRVTGIGPVDTLSSNPGFDILQQGDTINGHIVTNTFHTDLDNFQYHVVYVSGNGNDFVKDTQYTSDRNHVITVVAGYGIPSRAALIGNYEFTNKSVQYIQMNVDAGSPDVYNEVKQPVCSVSISNGQVSSISIIDGGSGWDSVTKTEGNQNLDVAITAPAVSTGRYAKVKGKFTGGALTSIEIVEPGSGYSSSDPPAIFVNNRYKKKTEVVSPGITLEETGVKSQNDAIADAGYFPEYTEQLNSPAGLEAQARFNKAIEPQIATYPQDNAEANRDSERNRLDQKNQALFSESAVKKLREAYSFPEIPLNEDIVAEELRDAINLGYQNTYDEIENGLQEITQYKIPEYKQHRETKVEAVQRRFADLPKASRLTKYFVTQYRADPRKTTKIKVTLSSEVAESGCDHVPCLPPLAPAGSSSSTSETNPTTGVTTNTTTSFLYSVIGPLGSGCENWSISGEILVYNNLTSATNTYSDAVEKYGNPFDL